MTGACRSASVVAAAALVCVASCSSHPTLKAPVHTPVQTQWEQVPDGISQSDVPAAGKPWWQVFHDPVLDRLMALGLDHNLDLQQAQARILQARAQRRGAAAALWPQVTASAGDVYDKTPLLPSASPTDSFTAALNASWTVDLFGQLRNQERAAAATLRATRFDRDATQVTLMAQIATEYLQYRLYQLQYAIATRSAESQAEVVRITRLRFEQGAASRLDLEQVVSQLALTRAAVPQAFEQADAARNALILLLASTPDALATDLPAAIVTDNPQLPASDPLEVLLTPAQVIEQRPGCARRRAAPGERGRQPQVGVGATLSAADPGRNVRLGGHAAQPTDDTGRSRPQLQLHTDLADFRFRPYPRLHRHCGLPAASSVSGLRAGGARSAPGNANRDRHVCARCPA